jgi:hypothetical protein
LRLRFQLVGKARKRGGIKIVDQARDLIDLLNVGGAEAKRSQRVVERIELCLLRNAARSG